MNNWVRSSEYILSQPRKLFPTISEQRNLERLMSVFSSVYLFVRSVHVCLELSIVKLNSRSRSQVRSRSGPRSGPKGPRTKDQRPGPGLTLNLVYHPLTTSKLFFRINSPNHYCMTPKHASLISAFKMTFRMTFRMIFKTWDFRFFLRRTLKGFLRGTSRGLQESF